MRTLRRLLVALACVAVSPPAAAQPSPPEVARAVSLFDQAKEKLAAGDIDASCRLFVESYRVDPQIGVLLNMALCHERAGKSASAWAEFTAVASLAARSGQAKRAEVARDHARRLEPTLTWVSVEVRDASPGLVVAIDGTAVDLAALQERIPVDPGRHTVRASAPGKTPWDGALTVEAGKSGERLVIPALADAPTAEAPPPPEPPPRASPRGRTFAWIGAGVATAALGFGGAAGLVAMSAQDEADRGCSGRACRTADALAADGRAHDWAIGSTIGFVAGGVLAATAIVLFILGR